MMAGPAHWQNYSLSQQCRSFYTRQLFVAKEVNDSLCTKHPPIGLSKKICRPFSSGRRPRAKQRGSLAAAAARLRFLTLWSRLSKPISSRRETWKLLRANVGRSRWASFVLHGRNPFNGVSHHLKNRREQLQELRKKTMEKSQQAKTSAVTLWRKYGYVGIAVYFAIYLGTLAGFYTAVNCGMLTADQVNSWISKLHLSGHIKADTVQRVDTQWGKLLLAWVATKVVEPLRLFLAVTATPSVARLLKKFRHVK